jgi:Thioredoxin-like
MYPHERSLVKRLADQPFALIGINSDGNRDELKKTMEKEQITWRSWWDGGSTQGPIATKWNVSGWPTIYVLDPKGVIRAKQVRGKAMDKVVDELLAELTKGPGK